MQLSADGLRHEADFLYTASELVLYARLNAIDAPSATSGRPAMAEYEPVVGISPPFHRALWRSDGSNGHQMTVADRRWLNSRRNGSM